MKIKLMISTKHNTTYSERLNYLSVINGSINKQSLFDKFNNAIGFKKVAYIYSCKGSVTVPEIETQEDYIAPNTCLAKAKTFTNMRNEIISFVMDEYTYKINENNNDYSYNTIDLLFKFSKFVKKVLPNVNLDFEMVDDNYKSSVQDFAFATFLSGLAYASNCNMEFSSHRLLTKTEKNAIMKVVSTIDKDLELRQYWCETCASYHADYPYHIEIIKKYIA